MNSTKDVLDPIDPWLELRKPHLRVTLEDKGQDFLWWELNVQGVVVRCGPHQEWLWRGTIVLNHAELKRGSVLHIRTRGGDDTTLNYRCRATKRVKP